MSNDKLRRQILFESARMMLNQQETNFHRARLKAARKLYKGWVKPGEMPSEQEIRFELQRMLNTSHSENGSRFDYFRSLLVPLAQVTQPPHEHPEGDALTHSLQVYDRAREEVPYDEELLLAALLHDVGKGIDPLNPVPSALNALGDRITERTRWLIENCPEAHKIADGTIGARARKRLQDSEDYRDVLFLAECDRKGRKYGIPVSSLDDALAEIEQLDQEYE